MHVVRASKPEAVALAAWFAELRAWFDRTGCQPSSFAPALRAASALAFEVAFRHAAEAKRFRRYLARTDRAPAAGPLL